MQRAMIRLLLVAAVALAILASRAFAQKTISITTTTPAGRDVVTVYSADRKIRVVIEEADDAAATSLGDDDNDDAANLNATVVTGEGANEETLWRTKIRGDLFEFGEDEEVIVSAKGDYFVLPPNFWHSDRVRIFTAGGMKKVDLREDKEEIGSRHWISGLEKIAGEDVLRIWHAQRDQWLAFTMPDAKFFNTSGELRQKWNAEARRKVLDLFAQKAKWELRERLEETAGPLAKLAALVTQDVSGATLNDAHYAFLLARKEPRDRKLLEAMLRKNRSQGQPRPQFWCGVGATWRDYFHFSSGDAERERADALLAAWDGKSTNKDPTFSLATPYQLAWVGGTVKLAAPILANSGTVHLHLIPEGKQSGRWTNEFASEHLVCELPAASSEQSDLVDEISYSFTAVTPGKYFVKAVWDKRGPRSDVLAAGPGDYESKLVGPVVFKAGYVVTNLVVACTNRAKGGDAYYSADAMAVGRWKVGELSPGMFSNSGASLASIAIPPRVELFSRRAAQWIIGTNQAAMQTDPKLLRVALAYTEVWAQRMPLWESRSESLPTLKFYFDERVDPAIADETELLIQDEHGCEFKTVENYKAWLGRAGVDFPRYPKASKTFRLIGRKDGTIAWDLTLTNLVTTNVVYAKGEQLPVSKDLGPVILRISGLRIGEFLDGVDAQFFTKGGERANGWMLVDETLVDDAGVDVIQHGICREETSAVLRASAVRDAENAPDTFGLLIPKSAAGEFVPMDVSTSLSGVKLTILGVVGGGSVRFELPDVRVEGTSSMSGGDFEVELRGNKVRVKTKEARLVVRAHAREDGAVIYLRGAEGSLGNGLGDDFHLDERTRLAFIPLDKHASNAEAEVTFAADKKIPVEFTIEPPTELKATDRARGR
jgi:hypothetical protein